MLSDVIHEVFSTSGLFTLLMLLLLQAVLGFDNLLYISIESKRVGEEKAPMVRRWGIGLAVLFRVVLLFIIVGLFDAIAEPLFGVKLSQFISGEFTFQSLVTMAGGAFIIYTAIKEISHLLTVEFIEHSEGAEPKSVTQAITKIVAMNLVFSFDSILSAMAIANIKSLDASGHPVIEYQVWLMAIAIIVSGVAMALMADPVANFLKKNRMYEVLGLFILLIVGVVLLGEAGPAAGHAVHNEALNIKLFGQEIIPMSKSTFYFSVVVLVAVEVIQSGYSRKLNAERKALQKHS